MLLAERRQEKGGREPIFSWNFMALFLFQGFLESGDGGEPSGKKGFIGSVAFPRPDKHTGIQRTPLFYSFPLENKDSLGKSWVAVPIK
jgi:hypothetical protein